MVCAVFCVFVGEAASTWKPQAQSKLVVVQGGSMWPGGIRPGGNDHLKEIYKGGGSWKSFLVQAG